MSVDLAKENVAAALFRCTDITTEQKALDIAQDIDRLIEERIAAATPEIIRSDGVYIKTVKP